MADEKEAAWAAEMARLEDEAGGFPVTGSLVRRNLYAKRRQANTAAGRRSCRCGCPIAEAENPTGYPTCDCQPECSCLGQCYCDA